MNKAEKITIKVLKVVERIARNEVEKTVLGRTAECSAIYHQPKRPKKRGNQVRIMKYFVECCGCDYRNGKTKGVRYLQKGYLTPINQLKVTAWASDGESRYGSD